MAPPTAPSGYPLQCFLPSIPYVRMIIRTYNPLSDNVLQSETGKKHFHFYPSRNPRRAKRVLHIPAPSAEIYPVTVLCNPSGVVGESAPAFGYIYETADAVKTTANMINGSHGTPPQMRNSLEAEGFESYPSPFSIQHSTFCIHHSAFIIQHSAFYIVSGSPRPTPRTPATR